MASGDLGEDLPCMEGERAALLLEVPAVCQYPELPTGCETVAAVMVLRYYGVEITPRQCAENWLKCDGRFYRSGGRLYGPDPNRVFVGDPFKKNSYGCFAPPIAEAVNRNSVLCRAETVSALSLDSLCREYLDRGIPVLVWATMNMMEKTEGNCWYLEDHSLFVWPAGEHCLVLVGYSDTHYFFNDPMVGKTLSYPRQTAEDRFEALGRQGVVITPREQAQGLGT